MNIIFKNKKFFFSLFMFSGFFGATNTMLFDAAGDIVIKKPLEFKSVDAFKALEEEFFSLDENSLLVLDVDGVLVLFDVGFCWLQEHCKIKSLPEEKVSHLISIYLKKKEEKPVEEQVSHQLKELQQKGIKIVALTSTTTKGYGNIECMPTLRATSLKELDIDFSGTFSREPFLFNGDTSKHVAGVLCVGRENKGEALVSFLYKTNFFPHKILFIDDQKDNLINVHEALEGFNNEPGQTRQKIEHTEILYTRALNYVQYPAEEIFHFQIDWLIAHKEWLSEEEARRKIEAEAFDRAQHYA